MATRPIYMCNKATMEVVAVFKDKRDAEACTGVKASGIYGDALCRSVSPGGYVWRFADDYDEDERFDGKHNRPVMCKDDEGHWCVFADVKAAEKKTGISVKLIRGSINRGTRCWSYRFSYYR